jgi:hypothetical protein
MISMPQRANGYRLDVGVPELRPLRIGEILDVAIKLTRRNFGTLVRIVAVIVVPTQILYALLLMTTIPSEGLFWTPGDPPPFGVTFQDYETFRAASNVLVFVDQIVLFFVIAACFKAVSDAYIGGSPDWKMSLGYAARRLLPLLGTTLLYILGLIPATLAFVIPGIWLSIAWYLYDVIVIAEKVGGPAALGRSFLLVKGRWWPTFGVVFLTTLISFLMAVILGFALGAVLLSESLQSDFALLVVQAIVGILASLLVEPFQAAVFTVLYYDLRVRKEGLDIELMAQAAGSPSPVGTPNLPPPPGYGPQPAVGPPPPPPGGRPPGSNPGT